MGLRFRKSISLGKHFRLNFSTKGIGYSIGGKGFRYTRSANGKHYSTYSIPGTGLSYRQSLDNNAQRGIKKSQNARSSFLDPPSSFKNNTKSGIIVYRILFLTFLFGGLILFSVACRNLLEKSSQTSSNPSQITENSPIQLLTLNNHPRINDPFNDAKAFYDVIGDDRIKTLDVAEFAYIEQHIESFDNDKNVLYILTNSQYVDSVYFNIICSEAYNLTVEDVAKIVIDYLPEDYFKYYTNDSSYIYGNDNGFTAYTYSSRLNDLGEELKKSSASQYSYYLYFRIYCYDGGRYWRVETGSAAYGDKDKGWIEKYAQKWDINLQALAENS